jgi:inhibitor of KinA sporulation pathway (predicted exonuclease)
MGMDEALKILQITLEGFNHRGKDDSKNITKILRYLICELIIPYDREKNGNIR